MITNDKFRAMRGCIEIALMRASDGKVLKGYPKRHFNAIVTGGRAWVLAHMLSGEGATSQVLGFLGVGEDTTAPTTADSALGSAVTRVAVGTWDTSGLSATTPYFRAQVQLATNEGNTTLAELGLFNSSASGTMLGHATFSTVDKTTSNTLGITYTISN